MAQLGVASRAAGEAEGATGAPAYDSTVTGGFDRRGLRTKSTHSGSLSTGGAFTDTHNARCELTNADWSSGTADEYTWVFDQVGKRTSATRNATTHTGRAPHGGIGLRSDGGGSLLAISFPS